MYELSSQSKTSLSDKKKQLRLDLKIRRSKLSRFQKKINQQRQLTKLKRLPSLKKSKRIAIYWSQPGEVSTQLIRRYLLRNNKHCFLPRVEKNGSLSFIRYRNNSPLQKNKYGILEPRFGKKLSAQKMNCALVPLLGIDTTGTRIGMGGGYYDRTFSSTKRKKHQTLIGLCMDGLEKNKIPKEPWDIKLNGALHHASFRQF